MKMIDAILKHCLICMEEHEVFIVRKDEETIFKNELVKFLAIYEYCVNADEFLETEAYIRKNDMAMKDAYRSKQGLVK